jgi:hypothetical protein
MNSRWDVQKMKYEVKVTAGVTGAVLAAAAALSGCGTGRWFDPIASKPATPVSAAGDLKLSTVSYIHQVCNLPKEQREPELRDLNELLLPHHAAIYCGRSGTP